MAKNEMTIEEFELLIAKLNEDNLLVPATTSSIADRFKKPSTYRSPVECLEKEHVRQGACKVLSR